MLQIVLTDRALLYKERDKEEHGKKNKKRKKKQLQSDTKFLYETNYERCAKGGRIFAKF